MVFRRDAHQKRGDDADARLSTNIPYIRTNDEKRYEGKLTYTPRAGHSLQASYINIDQVLNELHVAERDGSGEPGDQGQPSDLLSLHYTGVVSPNLFVEAQYSSRHLTFNTRRDDARSDSTAR